MHVGRAVGCWENVESGIGGVSWWVQDKTLHSGCVELKGLVSMRRRDGDFQKMSIDGFGSKVCA